MAARHRILADVKASVNGAVIMDFHNWPKIVIFAKNFSDIIEII